MRRLLAPLAVVAAALIVTAVIGRAWTGAVPPNAWVAAGNLNQVRAGASATLLDDGRVLFVGGVDADGATASTEWFSPATGLFLPLPAMTAPRANHTATRLADGRVLVVGGGGAEQQMLATAEIFDPETRVWSPAGAMGTPRRGHTATLLVDGRVLIAGGDAGGAAHQSLELFDPAALAFTPVPGGLAAGRTQHAATRLADGRVLIVGGSDGTAALTSSELFDPLTSLVTPGASLSAARWGLTATTLLDGMVLVAGGGDNTGALAAAELFDPATGVFSLTGTPLTVARQNHLAFLLPHNNQVLIAGGLAGNQAVTTAEYFTPWEANQAGSFGVRSGVFCAVAVCASGYAGPAASAARAWAAGAALSEPASETSRSGPDDGLLLLAGGSGDRSAQMFGFATIKTDQEDYAPGTTVTITGSGWEPGEWVALVLREVPEFHPQPLISVQADENGNIVSTEFVPDIHDIGIRFYLNAYGTASQAQTTFRDNGTISIVFAGTGSGSIASSSGTPNSCTANCVITVSNNGNFTLTATPATGSSFGGWSGTGCDSLASSGGLTNNVCNTRLQSLQGQSVSRSATVTFNNATAATTTSAGNASVLYGGPGVTLNATVTSTSTVNTGTVTFTVKQGATTIGSATTSGTVTGGAANVSYSLPVGTPVGSYSIEAVYNAGAGFSGSSDATPGTLSVNRAPLTITADSNVLTSTVDPFSKTYNGAPFTGFTARYAGFVNGETEAALGGTLSFSGEGTTATAAGGPYVVTPGGHTSSNYEITFVNGALNITPAAVTATAGSYSGTYDGAAHAPSACAVTGTYTTGLTCDNNPTSVGPHAGSGVVTPVVQYGGELSTNFTVTLTSGSFSITPAAVTMTAGGGTGTYNGATKTPSACAVTPGSPGGYVGALTCTNTPSAVGPNAGTTTITPTLNLNGETAGNFTVASFNGSYTIEPAAVTATAGSYSGTYDGAAHAPPACAVTGSYTTGLSCTNTPGSVGPNVGSGAVAPDVNFGGEAPTNFTVTLTNGNYSITAAAVTITAGGGTGTYNGATKTPSACAVAPGSPGGYVGALTCTNTPSAVGPNAGTTTITPTLNLNGETAGNFTVTSLNGSYTIDPVAVTATAGSYSGTYDGAAHAPSACAVTGSYTTGLSCTNTPASVGPNVGSGAVTPVVNFGSEAQTNFTVTLTDGSYNIAPAAVTVTAGSGSGTFNGGPQSPSACAVSGPYTGTLTCANNPASVINAGTYPIAPVPNFGAVPATNFTVTSVGGSFSIAPAPVTVTAGSGQWVFDSLAHSPAPCSASGLYVGTVSCTNSPASVGPLPGTWTVTPVVSYGAGLASNYVTTSVNGTAEIGYGTCGQGYGPGGVIQQPINVDGTSVFQRKGGSTIPVKFTVCGASGLPISDPAAVFAGTTGALTMLSAVRGTVTAINEVGDPINVPDVAFRWTGDKWIFNMATSNLSATTTYTFRINLALGYIDFRVGVK